MSALVLNFVTWSALLTVRAPYFYFECVAHSSRLHAKNSKHLQMDHTSMCRGSWAGYLVPHSF